MTFLLGSPVYVVDGCRTPFLKAKGVGPFSAADLAVASGQALLNRQSFTKDLIDEVILGCAMPSPNEANIARLVAQRLGCGDKVPGYTVMRNCASGLQAIDSGAMQIANGRSQLVLVGGTEAMSRAPVLFSEDMVTWLGRWMAAKKISQRLELLLALRPKFFKPVMGLLCGLTDSSIGMNMGQTAEELAYKFNLTREGLDNFASLSHNLAHNASINNHLEEIIPIIDTKGKIYTVDDGVRANSSALALAKLSPFFDKKYGMVTAGNSSQISDGACTLLLASAAAVERYQLPVLGRIVDIQWSALNPKFMGLGPVHAIAPILQRQNLTLASLDSLEINEAFAAQVLACLRAMADTNYCQQTLGLKAALGDVAQDILNPDGGAIAMGHPIGTSGARIVLHLLNTLKRKQGTYGVAALCIGGGQGGAILVERKERLS